jgi:AraC-like DNA-binding protein
LKFQIVEGYTVIAGNGAGQNVATRERTSLKDKVGVVIEKLSLVPNAAAESVAAPSMGSETIITRLIDVMFVEAVRAWLKDQPEGSAGWLGALRDPSIGTALGLLRKAPEKQWTVSSLAAQVGMSRSPFAARFTALVGHAPMSYLKRWRLQLAAKLLQNQALPLSSIAEQVGYESTPAFSRVFKREFGMSPGQYRRSSTIGERTSEAETHEAIASNSRAGAREVHRAKAVSPAAN